MRWVTTKPPKMLMEAMVTATSAIVLGSSVLLAPSAIIAPTTIMPETALVTAINGVCRAGVTFQTT